MLTVRTEFFDGGKILSDGIADVIQRFFLGITLRSTPWKPGNPNAITLFRLFERDNVA